MSFSSSLAKTGGSELGDRYPLNMHNTAPLHLPGGQQKIASAAQASSSDDDGFEDIMMQLDCAVFYDHKTIGSATAVKIKTGPGL